MRPATSLRTVTVSLALAVVAGGAASVPHREGPDDRARGVRDSWTPAAVAAAQPRELVVDAHGRGYLRRADGELVPHGHHGPPAATPLRAVPTSRPDGDPAAGDPRGRPAFDTDAPEVTDRDPAAGATVGGSHTFGATITDASGVKSVKVHVAVPADSPAQTFHATRETATGDRWSVVLDGLDGAGVRGRWWLEVRDGARRGGNTATTEATDFWVAGGDGGVGPGGVVPHAPWTGGGAVEATTGRVLFRMPSADDPTVWSGWLCSGTVVTDGATGRSVVLTAAHCVYDDVAKVFARDVLFVPDQGGTTASGSNRVCDDDPLGCWAPSFGVVAPGWADATWPANIPSDHGWYVVPDLGAHLPGLATADEALDVAVGSLPVSFAAPTTGAFTHALGFSGGEFDPTLMYCAEPLATEASYGALWLAACGLAGGSSGGPWVQPLDLVTGAGPVVSVSSWGWPGRDGMGGPHLSTGTAACTFEVAATGAPTQDRGAIPAGC